MAEFTKEQLDSIRESEEWKDFVKNWEDQGIDREPMLSDYLSNAANESYWDNKFKEQKVLETKDISEKEMANLAHSDRKASLNTGHQCF